jgi:hydrogenase maturation protease
LRTLVVGIGSTILSDDGVGVRVVERLRAAGLPEGVDTLELGTAGLALLDLVAGYGRLIVVDAIVTGAAPGTVHILRDGDVTRAHHLSSVHDADLPMTLALGRELPGLEMPADIVVVAIEADDLTTFSEELTPEVAGAVERAREAVVALASSDYL